MSTAQSSEPVSFRATIELGGKTDFAAALEAMNRAGGAR